MPNIFPAAAQGMPKINRRRLLGGMVAASTASAVAGGSAALAATHEPEVHPLERLHALHDEASELMAVHNQYMGGSWELRVRAPDDRLPVVYKNLADTPREQAIWHMRELQRLALEDGAGSAFIMLVGRPWGGPSTYTKGTCHTLMLDADGTVDDRNSPDFLASKGARS